MNLSVKGRHIDIGDALREHVEEVLDGIFGKYFGDAIEATVTVARDAHLYRAVILAHIGRGMQLQAQGAATEIYPAFEAAADRLSTRLRRYKRRLRDHGNKSDLDGEALMAQQYILAAEAEDIQEEPQEADGQPAVVAEIATEIPSLTVSEAVMRLDLAELSAMMFRNRAHGGLNMVYRRDDGNIGWIDPRGNSAG
jgi:ribosomal subunit interface protein